MKSTFNPNEKTYKVGILSDTTFVVKEEKIDYKTKSTGHAKVHELGINNLEVLDTKTLLTFIYMIANVNREPKAVWANLGKYFQDGFLCFSKHQENMAIDRNLDQTTVSRQLKKLRELGFIRPLNKEYMTKKGIPVPLVVYCLGEFDIHQGNKLEVHYYELSPVSLQNLVTKNKPIFYHTLKYQYNYLMQHVA